MRVHCLFEQSGTFKNEFKKLGIEAYDYDILNDYGETDFQIDLFEEIKTAYEGGVSIFDTIQEDDVVMAFFPCTYFQSYHSAWFLGRAKQLKDYNDEQKLEIVHERHEQLHDNYERFTELCLVAIRKGFRLIIENPYTQPHYLTRYFPVAPALIDEDRSKRGDFRKKPTQYWFLNGRPKNNFIFETVNEKEILTHDDFATNEYGKGRSLIHPDYANRFIREFIL